MKAIGSTSDLIGRELVTRRTTAREELPTNVRAQRVTARDEAPARQPGVLGMRAEAAETGVAGGVDAERVAWIRGELAAGRVGGPDDIDRAARALLEELW